MHIQRDRFIALLSLFIVLGELHFFQWQRWNKSFCRIFIIIRGARSGFIVCLGSAALAYLYWQLWYASRGGVNQIARYMPLLEVLLKTSHSIIWSSISIYSMYFFQQSWIYQHFPSLRPPQKINFDLPRACMWVWCGSASASVENLQAIHESFDCLRADEVNYFHTNANLCQWCYINGDYFHF